MKKEVDLEIEQSLAGSQEKETNSNDNQDVLPPPTKCFKHLERVSKLLDKDDEQDHQENRTSTISQEEQQLNRYIESKVDKDEKKLDPFEFWLKKRTEYPDLAQIACEILATPASTVPVERIFSSGGEVIQGKRNCLTDNNLEWEVFLCRNKKHIQ